MKYYVVVKNGVVDRLIPSTELSEVEGSNPATRVIAIPHFGFKRKLSMIYNILRSK